MNNLAKFRQKPKSHSMLTDPGKIISSIRYPDHGLGKMIHITQLKREITRYREIVARQISMHSASFQMDPLLHTAASSRCCLFLSAEEACHSVEVLGLQRKYTPSKPMLRLFFPFLIESFEEWLWGFVCGPADGSCRCVEQHSWLPSPHEPNVSITLYDCSKHIADRATSKAFATAYTLNNKDHCYSLGSKK